MHNSKKKFYPNHFSEIINKLTLNHFPNLYRPSGYPLISGDYFRKISNHIFDESKTLNPGAVNFGDLVFLGGDLLENYFMNYHPHINNKYILIIHNSTENVNLQIHDYLDDNIIHCFAKNLNTEQTKKLSCLPVGFKNKRYLNKEYNSAIIKYHHSSIVTKKASKIFSCFKTNTHPARVDLEKLVNKLENVVHFDFLKEESYFNELSRHKFSICPRGTSQDSFRVWESLLVGTMPIMINNQFSRNLKSSGIPIVIIDDWKQLSNFNDDLYNFDIQELTNAKKFTTADYWSDIISQKL